jgi:hypothetical protein
MSDTGITDVCLSSNNVRCPSDMTDLGFDLNKTIGGQTQHLFIKKENLSFIDPNKSYLADIRLAGTCPVTHIDAKGAPYVGMGTSCSTNQKVCVQYKSIKDMTSYIGDVKTYNNGNGICESGYVRVGDGRRGCGGSFNNVCMKQPTPIDANTIYCVNEKLSEPLCQMWGSLHTDEYNDRYGTYCQQGNNFTNNSCQQWCVNNNTLCQPIAKKYCQIGTNFLSDSCKEYCRKDANKAICDTIIDAQCAKSENKDNSYCSCYKPVNMFPGYESAPQDIIGYTHCIITQCINDGYKNEGRRSGDCPKCIQSINISGSGVSANDLKTNCQTSETTTNTDTKTDATTNTTTSTQNTTTTKSSGGSGLETWKIILIILGIIMCLVIVGALVYEFM